MTASSTWNAPMPDAPSRRRRSRVAAVMLACLGGLLLALAGRFYGIGRRQSGGGGSFREVVRAAYKSERRTLGIDAPPLAARSAQRVDAPLIVFGPEGLTKGWEDWSWAPHRIDGMTRRLLTMTPEGYKGVYFHHTSFSLAGYGELSLTLNRETLRQDAIEVCLVDGGGKFGPRVALKGRTGSAAPEGMVRVRVPLKALCPAPPVESAITGVVLQAKQQTERGSVRVTEIALTPDRTLPSAPTQATVAVTISPTVDVHPISPLIYGVAFADPPTLRDLGGRIDRWGGNPNTRYNWMGEAWNSARDWEFRNYGAAKMGAKPSEAADHFVKSTEDVGGSVLLTVPTIGWVAANGNKECRSLDVPAHGGMPLAGADGPIAGYDPDINRARTSVRSVARTRDARPGEVSQEKWVRHLVATFGTAKEGGVTLFAMDNEPDLWDGTHTDIHPAAMGYDDLLAQFTTYADMVKDVDPSAQVTGPVSWGWTGYLYSPRDRGTDNYHTHADRDRHGGTPFLLWFLKAVHDHDAKTGRRSLDVLDVHFYPQASNLYPGTGDQDEAMRALRLRSVRALWDPAYTDESWIGEPVRLIPRLKEWIAQGYPGTKIGLTEWNFGGEWDITGGLATAEALGVMGREGIYLANYWTTPPKNSPSYLAFKLFGNPDNARHGFGDTACRAVSASPEQVAVFAATDAATGDLTIVLVNKLRKATVTAPLTVNGGPYGAPSYRWQFGAANPAALTASPGPTLGKDGHASVTVPPYSATLLRFTRADHP